MNKYRAKQTTIDGIKFHSKGEAARYAILAVLEKSGKITDLKLQPKFSIVHNENKICTVIGDFEYMENGKWVVEDYKGFDTPMSRLKRKIVQAFYPSVEWRVVK